MLTVFTSAEPTTAASAIPAMPPACSGVVMTLFEALTKGGFFPAEWARWMPNIVVGILGVIALRWRSRSSGGDLSFQFWHDDFTPGQIYPPSKSLGDMGLFVRLTDVGPAPGVLLPVGELSIACCVTPATS